MTDPDTAGSSAAGGAARDSDVSAGLPRRTREAAGRLGTVVAALGVVIAVAHIYFNTVATLSTQWLAAWHYAGFAVLCTLLFPLAASRRRGVRRLVFAVDVGFGLAVAASAVFLISRENAIYDRGVRMTPLELAAACFVILSAIELTRRTIGWIIPMLIAVALSYVIWWGAWLAGVFRFAGLSAQTVLFRSIYGDDGMFGGIARISATVVFMFILFAAFLVRSGAGDVIINLARVGVGRLTGGPGLVAVFASALTGTISGSAVANTASTGSVTIPLMKRAGFPPRFAAGVEAAASTGGQLMPPIMGAGAFVMANLTAIPYTRIIAVSVLPAILYFLSVGFFVRIEAKRLNVSGGDEVPRLAEVLRGGGIVFLLPIALLIMLLIQGFTPTYAAGYAILAVIAASWLTPHKMGPRAIIEAMALGARNMIATAILLVAIGLVVNVLATTGVGNTLSLMIRTWAGNSLLIALVLIALASLILGMGLPVTAAYVIVATVSAPALVDLISTSHVVDAIIVGQLPEAARTLLLLAPPEIAEALSRPLAPDEARAVVATLFNDMPDLYLVLRDALLDPAVVTATLLSAHLIVFWLSQDSNITPPVCLTAFAAAAIARTPPMATGLMAWKIAKSLYIVPLLFAYTGFVGGTTAEVTQIFAFAIPGLYAITAALQGYLEAPLNWPVRGLALACGTALLWPGGLALHSAGAVMFGVLFAWSWRTGRRAAHAPR